MDPSSDSEADSHLRILHVYKDYFPVLGGIENHIKVLAEAQAARGHDVTALVANPAAVRSSKRLTACGWSKPGDGPPWLRRLSALRCSAGRRASRPTSCTCISASARRSRAALVRAGQAHLITYHSDNCPPADAAHPVSSPAVDRAAPADRLIATSAAYIESSRYLSRLREKCTVVPIGADLERFDRVDPARLESLASVLYAL